MKRFRRFLHKLLIGEILMSIPALLQQVLTNQSTILANQATFIGNQATALQAIQNIPGANSTAITDALTLIEGQVKDIQTQVDDANASASTAVAAAAAAPPAPAAVPGTGS